MPLPSSVAPEALIAALSPACPGVTFIVQSRYAVRFQHANSPTVVSRVERIAAAAGWMLTIKGTTRHPCECLVEATHTDAVDQLTRVYHVSHARDRQSISASGLVPSARARTWTGRSYPTPRVHFTRTLAGSIAFVRSTIPLYESRRASARIRAQCSFHDVWRVDARGLVFAVDALMHEEGVWTVQTVPRSRLHRLRFLDVRVRVLLTMHAQGLIRI